MLKPRLVVRNLLAMGTGHVIDRVLAMVLTVYLARVLGAAAFGIVGIGMVLLRFGTALVVGGTVNLGVRRVARSESNVPETYARITGFRLLGALVILVVGVATLAWVPGWLDIPGEFLLMYLLILLVQSLTLAWLFRGLEKMHTVAGMGIAESVLALVLTIALVNGPDDLLRVPVAHLAAATVVIFWAQRWAHKRYDGLGINLKLDALRETARESVTISLSGLLLNVSLQGAVLFLGLFGHDTAMAGQFLASQRIVLTLYGVTLLVPGVIFPATARLMHSDPNQAADLQDRLIRVNLTLLMSPVVLSSFYADEIIELLYGESFAAAAMVLRIMIWSVPLVVIYNGLRQTLLAAAIIRPIFLTTLFGAVVHGILSWLLIPGWGLRGAAVANLSGFVVLVLSMVVFVRYTLKRIPMGPDLLGPVAATAVSYAALIVSDNWPWPAQLASFAVAYGATALLTGSISRDELKALVAMVPGVRNRRDRAADE